MGKNLLAKAGLVLAPRPTSPSVDADAPKDEPARPKTAIGAMAQFTDRQSQAIKEATKLKEQLKEYDGSLPVKRISPALIVRSKWANRHDLSFTGPEFEALKRDISEQGGNVQPIKVRHVTDRSDTYEIVFGHRRHQACLELGIPVLAVIEDVDDKQLFIEMDRENRARHDLRPYEVGAMYSRVLDEGLFPSARRLAEEVGIDHSQLSKALALARIPSDVLAAFPSPLELQYRWASDLVAAVQNDPDHVIAVAGAIKAGQKLPAVEVFKRLIQPRGTFPHVKASGLVLSGSGDQMGTISFNKAKRSVRIDLANIDPSRFDAIQNAIKKLLR